MNHWYFVIQICNISYCILSSLLLFNVNSSSSVNFEGNPPKSTNKCYSFFTCRKSVSLSCIKYKNYLTTIQINHMISNCFQCNNSIWNEWVAHQSKSCLKQSFLIFSPFQEIIFFYWFSSSVSSSYNSYPWALFPGHSAIFNVR